MVIEKHIDVLIGKG